MTSPLGGRTRERSVLEEERDFFLRSLHDLDAEHAAGDIDDVDYRSLRDDYTVRAADVVRQLAALDTPTPPAARPVPAPSGRTPSEPVLPRTDAPGSAPSGATAAGEPATAATAAGEPATAATAAGPMPVVAGPDGQPDLPVAKPTWRRPWFLLAAALIVSAGVAWAVLGLTQGTETTAQRVAGLQVEAQAAINRGDAIGALTAYSDALRLDPTNPTSLTGEGIVYVGASEGQRNALLKEGETELRRAEIANPSYFPAYGWRGIALYYLGDYRAAIPQLETYLAEAPRTLREERQVVSRRLAQAKDKLATGAT